MTPFAAVRFAISRQIRAPRHLQRCAGTPPWGSVRRRQRLECAVQELPGAIHSEVFEHLVAEIAQADVAVPLGVLRGQLWQHIAHPPFAS